MPQHKYVAKDCVAYFQSMLDSNWLANYVTGDFNNLFNNTSNDMRFIVRSLTIETTTETVDATGIMQGVAAFVDNKFDARVTMSRLVPLSNIPLGGRVNDKAVSKLAGLTLTLYNNTSFRSSPSGGSQLSFQGMARSIDLTFTVENTRVDGFGDVIMYKRPVRVDGRCRIEGLVPHIVQTTDWDWNLLYRYLEQSMMIANVNVSVANSVGNTYIYGFTGGVSRVGVNVDNPIRQDIELVNIGFMPETDYSTAVFYDPALNLFDITSGSYSSLAFGVGILFPKMGTGTGSPMRVAGFFGVEEFSLSINETEVVHNITGTIYNADVQVWAG